MGLFWKKIEKKNALDFQGFVMGENYKMKFHWLQLKKFINKLID